MHPVEGIYVPEMIFGKLLTSQNYDQSEAKTVAGRNGYGAKLCNVFSTQFIITVGDPSSGLQYTQQWANNMTVRGEPTITDYNGDPFVQIVYVMDFKRFGYDKYTEEAYRLFARHAADLALTCKVPVYFNQRLLQVQDIFTYTKWLLADDDDETPENVMSNSIVHSEWHKSVQLIKKKNKLVPVDSSILPMIELCMVDTPDRGQILTYVNGIITRDGGVHVDSAVKALTGNILEVLNSAINKSNKKGEKTTKSRKLSLNAADVKRHTTIVMSCRLVNPRFTSQMKTKLSYPKPSISIAESKLKKLMSWNLLDRLHAELVAKQYKALEKTDGKKRRHIDVDKLEDANWAGTPKSQQCALYITEGDSAMGYATTMFGLVKDGRNTMGVMPIRGKMLNVRNATFKQKIENKEIQSIKGALGLKENVDYMDDDNYKTLRYGRLVILADSDVDGKHIVGLLINFFDYWFKSLLQRGFVMFMRTPIIRAGKGKNKLKFYTLGEYDRWKDSVPNYKTWKPKYFKGLGTSTKGDITDDFKTPKYTNLIYDNAAGKSIELAFRNKLANARKVWLDEYDPTIELKLNDNQPITEFINTELIEYSFADTARSLPRAADGLKESQRKIVWACMLKWGAKVGAPSSTEVKTKLLAAYAMGITNYQHGELDETINKMELDFPGTNNMNYLYPGEQFGTRNKGGKDAAATRYTHTKPMWWWPYMFKREDKPLLTLVIDEGEECEPIFLLPIIPMSLVNGCRGIGTGHSTFIPPHNPLDLCYWLIAKISNKALPKIKPWYRGFTGRVYPIMRSTDGKRKTSPVDTSKILQRLLDDIEGGESSEVSPKEDDVLEEDNFELTKDGRCRLSVATEGIFEETHRGSVTITELPIERSMHKYKEWLDIQVKLKNITSYDNLSGENPKFIIKGMATPSVNKLRLRRTFGMSNLVLLDNKDKPIHYRTITDILEQFYKWRVPFYDKRRINIIANLEKKIKTDSDKARFIRAVIDGTEKGPIVGETIVLMRKNKKVVYPQMDAMNLPHKLLDTVKAANFTEDEIAALKSKIAKYTQDRESMINSKPSDLWLKDINEFLVVYRRHYKD